MGIITMFYICHWKSMQTWANFSLETNWKLWLYSFFFGSLEILRKYKWNRVTKLNWRLQFLSPTFWWWKQEWMTLDIVPCLCNFHVILHPIPGKSQNCHVSKVNRKNQSPASSLPSLSIPNTWLWKHPCNVSSSPRTRVSERHLSSNIWFTLSVPATLVPCFSYHQSSLGPSRDKKKKSMPPFTTLAPNRINSHWDQTLCQMPSVHIFFLCTMKTWVSTL